MAKSTQDHKMKNLIINTGVEAKLKQKHTVTRREIEQCFDNKCGEFLIDDREEHRSNPPTLWFVAPTNKQRILKVVFIFKDGNIILRTAYEPNPEELRIYESNAK